MGHQWVPIILWRKKSPRGWMKSVQTVGSNPVCSRPAVRMANLRAAGANVPPHVADIAAKPITSTRGRPGHATNHGCAVGRIARRTIGPTTNTRLGHIAHASRRFGGQISKTNRSRGVLGILGGCTAHDAKQTSRGCRRHHPTFGARSRAWRMFA